MHVKPCGSRVGAETRVAWLCSEPCEFRSVGEGRSECASFPWQERRQKLRSQIQFMTSTTKKKPTTAQTKPSNKTQRSKKLDRRIVNFATPPPPSSSKPLQTVRASLFSTFERADTQKKSLLSHSPPTTSPLSLGRGTEPRLSGTCAAEKFASGS